MTVQLTMPQIKLLRHLGRYDARSRLFLVNFGFSLNTIDAAQRLELIVKNEKGDYTLTEKGKNFI